MRNYKLQIKEIVKSITISIFFMVFTIFLFSLFVENRITPYISLLNSISYRSNKKSTNSTISFDKVSRRLKSYPEYGSKFATIKIDKIGLSLPVYHGDTLDILRYGVGHLSGSYFPGEGHGIVMDAHNSYDLFGNLPRLSNGDKIVIETDYGKFTYEVYSHRIINKTQTDALEIDSDSEELMLYTCYPVNTPGLIPNRYLVYAKLVGEVYE